MPLPPGTRLDGYELLAPIGAGAMGEVYRARDSSLKREVAIKVLSHIVSQNPDRLHRFQQEAEAAAALNHPNILAVFQLGTFNGSPYLVSELLEGETLRQAIDHGPLPIRKAIEYGREIARGLAAAHERGIVHRDLKPENLFVTRDGRVKILDFGLAKLTQRPTAPTAADPTQTHQDTEPGMILGTLGYMSPEQVRGQAVDHRADIFAFGAILYEMLAGKRAFQRSTSADTMAAILNEEPPGISGIVRATPPGLQRVIYRCLEKNPGQRFQSASDLAFALEALSEPGSDPGLSPAPPPRHKPSKALLWIAGVAAALLLATAGYYAFRPKEHVPFAHYSIQKVIDNKHVSRLAISPDANYLAAVIRNPNDTQSLLLHHVPTNSERFILEDPDYKYEGITFSPDGSYIYLWLDALGDPAPDRKDEYRVPVLGGKPIRLLEHVDAPPDFILGGQRLCVYRQDSDGGTYRFLSVALDGSDEQVLATGTKPFMIEPLCAPDGRAALGWTVNEVQTLDFAPGSQPKPFLPSDFVAFGKLWIPDTKGLYIVKENKNFNGGQIFFVSYPAGKQRQVTNDLGHYQGLSLSADGGTLATRIYERNLKFAELPLAGSNNLREHEAAIPEQFRWVDKDRIVANDLGASNIAITDLVRNESSAVDVSRQFRSIRSMNHCGSESFVSQAELQGKVGGGIYRMQLDGSQPTQLTRGPADMFPECSPDGKWLFYADNNDYLDVHLVRQSLDGKNIVRSKKTTVFFGLSPDGKYIAHVDWDLDPRLRLQILSADSMQEVKMFPMPPDSAGNWVVFSADGKSVFYDSWNGSETTVWRQSLDASGPVKVTTIKGKRIGWLAASPDGSRLGLSLYAPTSEAVLIHDLP